MSEPFRESLEQSDVVPEPFQHVTKLFGELFEPLKGFSRSFHVVFKQFQDDAGQVEPVEENRDRQLLSQCGHGYEFVVAK
jgi:hypothetical protein